MLVFGLGAGLAFPSLMTLAMSGATPEDSGLASGLVNTSVQVGGAIGLAVLATLASERTSTLEAAGKTASEALNGGYHLAYIVGAGLVAVALVVAAFVLEEPEPMEHPELATDAESVGQAAYSEA
jgi:MFS family permease